MRCGNNWVIMCLKCNSRYCALKRIANCYHCAKTSAIVLGSEKFPRRTNLKPEKWQVSGNNMSKIACFRLLYKTNIGITAESKCF